MKLIKEKMIEWTNGQPALGFNTRAEFVAAVTAGKEWPVGSVVFAGGYAYRYLGTGTVIPDMPGWVGVDPKVDHFDSGSLFTAVLRMQSALGYVRFAGRAYTVIQGLSTADAIPVHFDPGAVLDLADGTTSTFRGRIVAGEHQIFRRPIGGTGTVYLNGEAVVTVKAAWWGIFPDNGDVVTCYNFMLEAPNPAREMFVQFDTGIYSFETLPNDVPRAVVHKGTDDRHTHFKLSGDCDNANVFRSSESGMKFIDLQMTSDTVNTSGSWIDMLHNRCEVKRVFFNNHYRAVSIYNGARDCVVQEIYAKRNSADGISGSCAVYDEGTRSRISEIECTIQGGQYMECAVRSGGNANGFHYWGINAAGCSQGVKLQSGSGSISNGRIEAVLCRDYGSGTVGTAVSIRALGAGDISQISVIGCQANGVTGNGFVVEETSTGRITDIDLVACTSVGESGSALSISIATPSEVRTTGGNL